MYLPFIFIFVKINLSHYYIDYVGISFLLFYSFALIFSCRNILHVSSDNFVGTILYIFVTKDTVGYKRMEILKTELTSILGDDPLISSTHELQPKLDRKIMFTLG